MADDAAWDIADFLTQYTSKSISYSSPVKTDLLNGSLGSDKSPQRFDGNPVDNDIFCTSENLEDRLHYLNQVNFFLICETLIFNVSVSSNVHEDECIVSGANLEIYFGRR